MQPLAYQIGENTCWPTSIINGIMYLRDGEGMESFEYETLHALLNSLLRKEGVLYYEDDDLRAFERTIERLEKIFSLQIRYTRGENVADEIIRNLHFTNQVAICDVANGEHSILLTKKRGNWLSGFDPWWYGDERDESIKNDCVQFPKKKVTENVRIHLEHLLGDSFKPHKETYARGEAYPMGKNMKKRFLTVMEIK